MLATMCGCSVLNESIAPVLDCASAPASRVCEDAVLGVCVGGEANFRVCEDDGLVCGETDGVADCVVCAAQCRNRVCGDDACGGTCGQCPVGATCTATGQCDPPVAFAVTSVEIVDDENGDDVVSPGESSGIRIRLENTGIALARQVRATLVVTSENAGIDAGPVLYFGELDIGASACGASDGRDLGSCDTLLVPRFRVFPGVLPGSRVDFSLAITTSAGHAVETIFSYELAVVDHKFAVSRVEVVSEPNGDGVLSPGEGATIRVTTRNDGTATGIAVVGVLSAESPGVTVFSPTVYFGDLGASESSCGSRTQAEAGSCTSTVLSSVRVDAAAVGPWVTLRMSFLDGFGTRSDTMFTLGIGPIDQAFSLANATVVSDTNGDGTISPGEWGFVRLELRNSGAAGALGITGALTSNDPRVNVNNGAKLYFGDIGSGDGACGAWKLSDAGSCTTSAVARITISSEVAVGTVVSLPLIISDRYGNKTELSYDHTVVP